ncbi:hypothetical protein D3C86_1994610 [compost metagenome]
MAETGAVFSVNPHHIREIADFAFCSELEHDCPVTRRRLSMPGCKILGEEMVAIHPAGGGHKPFVF